jgi:hypothetical protein
LAQFGDGLPTIAELGIADWIWGTVSFVQEIRKSLAYYAGG